jgi:hypothetical protein
MKERRPFDVCLFPMSRKRCGEVAVAVGNIKTHALGSNERDSLEDLCDALMLVSKTGRYAPPSITTGGG